MDKTMCVINYEREDYILYLISCKGYDRKDAEEMADIMGY